MHRDSWPLGQMSFLEAGVLLPTEGVCQGPFPAVGIGTGPFPRPGAHLVAPLCPLGAAAP